MIHTTIELIFVCSLIHATKRALSTILNWEIACYNIWRLTPLSSHVCLAVPFVQINFPFSFHNICIQRGLMFGFSSEVASCLLFLICQFVGSGTDIR